MFCGLKRMLCALALLLPTALFADTLGPHMVVTGVAEVQTLPDMAVVDLGVTAQSANAQDAMDQVSEDVRAIFQSMVDLGVAPRDVQTTALRLDPVFANRNTNGQGPPEIQGFVATNDLALRLRDMTQLGSLLQAVLDEGANRFSSIRFTLADPTEAENAARQAAIADAQGRAALYAEAAGVTLGQILSITEGPARVGEMRPMGARMAMESAIPLAGGELTISAQVTITYAIAE